MNGVARAWFSKRTIGASCPLLPEVVARKRDLGVTISVCLPALDEETTVGDICTKVRVGLMEDTGLVDDLVVVDSGSRDGTALVAQASGARVVRADAVDVGVTPASVAGKGEALWKSLAIITSDIIVWADADTRNFQPDFVTRLVAPLLADSSLVMTKAFYERPHDPHTHQPGAGGRITEIVVRPLLALLHPDLTGFVQPLSGEYAIHREAAMSMPFPSGYGVEAGLLIDIAAKYGLFSIAQVDLGTRFHRPRDLLSLGKAAAEISHVIMRRAEPGGAVEDGDELDLNQFEQTGAWPVSRPSTVRILERPPMQEMLQSLSVRSTGITDGATPLLDGRA